MQLERLVLVNGRLVSNQLSILAESGHLHLWTVASRFNYDSCHSLHIFPPILINEKHFCHGAAFFSHSYGQGCRDRSWILFPRKSL